MVSRKRSPEFATFRPSVRELGYHLVPARCFLAIPLASGRDVHLWSEHHGCHGRNGQLLMLKHGELTHRIIGGFFDVYRELGPGFLERLYQQALVARLEELSLPTCAEVPFQVHYHGVELGTFQADIVVCDCILLELKAVECLVSHHEKQILNYLKASGLEVGLLLNFGPRPQVRRFIQDRIRQNQPPHYLRAESDPRFWSE